MHAFHIHHLLYDHAMIELPTLVDIEPQHRIPIDQRFLRPPLDGNQLIDVYKRQGLFCFLINCFALCRTDMLCLINIQYTI